MVENEITVKKCKKKYVLNDQNKNCTKWVK